MRSLLLAVVASVALPATALAAGPAPVPVIPPSNPGANQYLEDVPTATGSSSSQAVFQHATSGKRGANRVLPAATQKALARYGSDGRQAAALAAATAPSTLGTRTTSGTTTGRTSSGSASTGIPSSSTHRASSRGKARSATRTDATGIAGTTQGATTAPAPGPRATGAAGSAPVASILRSAIGAGSGGIDLWLPLALVVSAAGVAAVALLRRRAG